MLYWLRLLRPPEFRFRHGLLTIVSLLLVFAIYQASVPSVDEATSPLPGTDWTLSVQLRPMHAFLAEYKRRLVLHIPNGFDQSIEMFPDTGGYRRTQLYEYRDGRFLVKGYHDAFIVDVDYHEILEAKGIPQGKKRYLGAFDFTKDHEWRFIPALESPEESMIPGGG